jgi:hypothetical protein
MNARLGVNPVSAHLLNSNNNLHGTHECGKKNPRDGRCIIVCVMSMKMGPHCRIHGFLVSLQHGRKVMGGIDQMVSGQFWPYVESNYV